MINSAINFAVIFDMDGVMVDNISYHIEALNIFCQRHNCSFTDEEFKQNISGKTTKEVMNYIFKRELNFQELINYTEEKESIYRDLYSKHLCPTKGLVKFLKILRENNIKIAVATAGPKINLDFVLKGIKADQYFEALVNGDMVENGKPDPEIYLKAAKLINVEPSSCIVIEDSIMGIRSGLNAGMKVIGITTVHSRAELKKADYIIDDFEQLSIDDLKKIVNI